MFWFGFCILASISSWPRILNCWGKPVKYYLLVYMDKKGFLTCVSYLQQTSRRQCLKQESFVPWYFVSQNIFHRHRAHSDACFSVKTSKWLIPSPSFKSCNVKRLSVSFLSAIFRWLVLGGRVTGASQGPRHHTRSAPDSLRSFPPPVFSTCALLATKYGSYWVPIAVAPS